MLSKEKILDLTNRWETYWNDDPMRMVDESYAADCQVHDMLSGITYNGREELRAAEALIMKVDPTRRMTSYYVTVAENRAILEADMTWKNGDISAKACVFLTFNDEGFVVEDHTYTGPVEGLEMGQETP